MAKIIAPLLSLEAHGTLGKYLTFSKRKSGQQVRYQRKQTDVNTTDQQTQRAIYQDAVASWNALSSAQQKEYNDDVISKKLKMSGYNLYIQEYIHDLISATPRQITDLQFWVNPEAGVYSDEGNTQARNNDLVREWRDQSGYGRNLKQTTITKRPTFKTNIFDNKPALYFNGSNVLRFLGGANDTLSQPNTIFSVAKLETTGSAYHHIFDGTDFGYRNTLRQHNNGTWSMYAGTTIYGGSSDTNANIFTSIFNETNSETRKNGTRIMSGDVGTQSFRLINLDFTSTGYSNGWLGHIAEIIIYNRQLTSNEITQIEQYLSTKYNISLS